MDEIYAVLKRENHRIRLQSHADMPDAPLLRGSVVKIFVKKAKDFSGVCIKRYGRSRKVAHEHLWNTNELGFYDLYKMPFLKLKTWGNKRTFRNAVRQNGEIAFPIFLASNLN